MPPMTPPEDLQAVRNLAGTFPGLQLDAQLDERLAKAAGFRNFVARAYEHLDMKRVHASAKEGSSNLLAFLRIARGVVTSR